MLKATSIAIAVIIYAATPADAGSTSLARIVEPLKSKAEQIVRECRSRVVSTDMRGGKTPNHRQHRAVDIQGNPACIYRALAGWPGGYSTDYATAPGGPHVHISYSRKHEWGRRFAHTHGPRLAARTRLARARPNVHAHFELAPMGSN